MNIFTICRQHLRHFRGSIWLAIIAMVMQTSMTLLAPWPLKYVFDSILGTHALPQWMSNLLSQLFHLQPSNRVRLLSILIITMLVISLFAALFTYISSFLTSMIGQRIIYRLRQQVFDHLQHLSLSFHRQNKVGDLSARVTSDIQSIQDLVTSGLNTFFTSALNVLGVIVIVTFIDWHFALLMLFAIPLLMFVAGSYRSRIRQASRQVRKVEGQVGATAQEKLNAIQVVQGFTNEDAEADQFASQTRESLDAGLILSRLQSEMTPMVDLVGGIAVAAIVWLGARAALYGQLTPGYLLLFITYFRSTLSPIRQIAKLSSQFSKAEASAERIQQILEIESTVRDLPGARPAPRLAGAITFDHVSFAYTPGTPVLRGIAGEISPGMKVALVGMTGSGKSTLLSLIPRFHDPIEGRVLIDGIDLREYTLQSLRQQISLVFQEPILFTGTIRDNIAYGRSGTSDVAILQAARDANAHNFIMRLPQGYATIIGERGGTLSGGQRQMIAIARALIRNSPILLLDEPTTGLDVESEAQVMEALDRLMRGRTTIMIAHRLNTVERADLILVMQQGRIVETGTHASLAQSQSIYARWRAIQSHASHNDAQAVSANPR